MSAATTQDPALFGTAPPRWEFVPTLSVQALDQALTEAVAGNRIIGVDGPSGAGKTTALRHLLPHVQVPVIRMVGSHITARSSLYRALIGGLEPAYEPDRDFRRSDQMQKHVADLLRTGRRLVVVDEANEMRREAVNALQMTHDDGLAQFAICLCGENLRTGLQPYTKLRNRVSRWVDFFLPTDTAALLDLLHRLHPLLGASSDDVLLRVHASLRPASLREWEHVAANALSVDPAAHALDELLAQSALARKGWTLR